MHVSVLCFKGTNLHLRVRPSSVSVVSVPTQWVLDQQCKLLWSMFYTMAGDHQKFLLVSSISNQCHILKYNIHINCINLFCLLLKSSSLTCLTRIDNRALWYINMAVSPLQCTTSSKGYLYMYRDSNTKLSLRTRCKWGRDVSECLEFWECDNLCK